MKVNKLTLIIFLLTVVINNSQLVAQEIIKDTILKIENTEATILEDEIIKNAKDSISIDIINRKIYLYGKAEIKYSDIKISAGYIEIDWNTNTITAKPKIDSTGQFIEKPIF